MNGNNGFGKNTLIGGALLLVSLAIAVIGVIVSLRTGSNRYFLVASIPTAALIVAGGMMIRQGILTGENRLLLPGGETTITAEVLGVTRNLRTAGEKTAYYIVCRYKNPVTGQEETFSSRPLAEYPGKEVIGKQVTVHLDPVEKGKYVVEIEPLLEAVQKERAGNAQENAAQANPDVTMESAAQEDAEQTKPVEENTAQLQSAEKIAKEEQTGGEHGGTA